MKRAASRPEDRPRAQPPRWSVRRGVGVRTAIVAAGLGALTARVGTGPIVDALTGLTPSTVLLALGLGAVATASSAARWRAVGRAVGVEVPIGAAAAGVYRATLLNSVLPGGFLGDLDRALAAHQHARPGQDPHRAARVVVLERCAGQAVVFAAAVAVVVISAPALLSALLPALLPDLAAARGAALLAAGTVVVTSTGAMVLAVRLHDRAAGRVARGVVRARRQVAVLRVELRGGLLNPRTATTVVASSLVGFATLLATFALAVDVVGVPVPRVQLLGLCTVGLVAMAVPVNVGGWGPRELATAAAFAAAGLGAPVGLAVSVVYGVLSLLGCLPGAIVLGLGARAHSARAPGAHARGVRAAGVGPAVVLAADQPQVRPSSRAASLARYAGEASPRPQ